MKKMAPIFGVLAIFFLGFLGIGWALPGTWTAEQSLQIDRSAEEVFPFLSDLALWEVWTVWSELESIVSTPSDGVGATRSWDDPNFGGGRIEIVEVIEPTLVRYRVELEGGKSRIDGKLILSTTPDGATITWVESGDFGRNPLMGYMARRMPESQAAQMLESLQRLELASRNDARVE